jgi:hypothetical protein
MLPKINHPVFDFTIPSTNKKMSFRPFLVKEEKLLLMAKASEDPADIFKSIKQIINNCCLDDVNVNDLAIFDMEYLFIKLRAISVNDTVEVSYRDNEDDEIYKFEIDLNKVEVLFPEKAEKQIKINESSGIIMKWPTTSIFDELQQIEENDSYFFNLVLSCIDKIYDEDSVYNAKDYSKKELEEFLDNCNVNVYSKINEFVTKAPQLNYKIEYKNSKGTDREIVLKSLTDFFTLR